MLLKDRILKYRIFAAYRTESTSEGYTRSFSEELSFTDYMELVYDFSQGSLINQPTNPAPLLMLSTCTSDHWAERFVVNAALIAWQ